MTKLLLLVLWEFVFVASNTESNDGLNLRHCIGFNQNWRTLQDAGRGTCGDHVAGADGYFLCHTGVLSENPMKNSTRSVFDLRAGCSVWLDNRVYANLKNKDRLTDSPFST